VVYLRPRDVFLVILDDGRLYQLQRGWLEMLDRSEIVVVSVNQSGRFFVIEQRSGNRIEVPWDRVLYHCEPEYRYYHTVVSEPSPKNDLGRRLRQARWKAGLTQAKLAALTGIKRPNIARIESGRHRPSLDTIDKIARALGVPVVDLVAR
jgi:DNA-binding XRE family transcriptional regulator